MDVDKLEKEINLQSGHKPNYETKLQVTDSDDDGPDRNTDKPRR
jgi:hypothetical protein